MSGDQVEGGYDWNLGAVISIQNNERRQEQTLKLDPSANQDADFDHKKS